MNEELLKIISFYGVIPQLEYYQSEVWELNEAISEYETERYHYLPSIDHIAEEIADNCVMLYQIPLYYYQKLEVHNIAPYEFKTDNYEQIMNINEYIKDFTKTIFKLNRVVIIAEEREQDYIEYYYEEIIDAVDEVLYKLMSIKEYYGISNKKLEEIGKYKINRQIGRLTKENC